MTDLHCHILPGMDDGAKDVEASLELLSREYQDGVRQIALTSHFNTHRTTVEEFLTKREQAYAELTKALAHTTMNFHFKLGAEVFFTPQLRDMDAGRLCIEGTPYILIEFPLTHRPHFIRETFSALEDQGIYPLIAHVERYPYMLDDPGLLYELVAAGAYAQINAGALLRSGQTKQILNLLKWELAHVIATDTHSLDKRPPQMAAAMELIGDKMGKPFAEQLVNNSTELFHGTEPDVAPHNPRKFLGRWI